MSSLERGGAAMLGSYATTLAVARGVSYVRERRRRAPLVRSIARRAADALRPSGPRVHHFVPGIGILALSGAIAVLTRDDGFEAWLGVPFGVGAGLTADELGLLVEDDNGYWDHQGVALAQAGVAAAGAAAMGARLCARRRHYADGRR